MKHLAGDLVCSHQQYFVVVDLNSCMACLGFDLCNERGYSLVLILAPHLAELLTLDVAESLLDEILRVLGCDALELVRVYRNADLVAYLRRRVELARFFENYLDLRLIQGVDHLDDFLKYAHVEDLPVEIYVDEHALAVLVLNMHAGLEALFDSALDLLSEHVLVDTLFSSVSGKRVKKFSDVVLGLLYFLLSHFPLIPPLKN